MGLVTRLFGRKRSEAREAGLSHLQIATREQTRRELIALALRDTLKRHGLAAGCITAEALPSVVGRRRGLHIQLVFRDWQPSLLSYVVALEAAVKARLAHLDPLSTSWLMGMSWRFEPTERSLWPQLPAPELRSRSPPVLRDAIGAAHRFPKDNLLPAGDDRFQDSIAARPDFSPTLPMAKN
ncbi:hypothetical protein [Ramlibacter sp. AN1133]|uniref:hypothetical protein n=1 Tax=Ramlibacter sp. AN1133 TaxID=3133429 RepID=UPI0030C1362F